jgi:long-chain acyl-CoA synthetase
VLFEQWLKTLDSHRDETAVKDSVSGTCHTFGDLQREVEKLPALPAGQLHAVSVAEGITTFLLQTLRAWRDRAVLCPMESEARALPDLGSLPEGIVHLKQTSGSTGEPRLVLFTAAQLAADAANIKATMGLDSASLNLAVISVAHSYGFSNLILPLLLQGHPLMHVPDALPGSLRQAFALGSSFTLPAVPAMWRAWHQAGLLKGSPITLAISAGAPLPLELERAVFDDSGLKLHNFYGSSECGGIAYDQSRVPRDDASLAGTAMNGVSLSVNEDGCLVVSGANVAEGYLGSHDVNLAEGRFTTSDLADLRGGSVHIRGRISDAINIAGRKLNPADVEAALLAHPEVRHAVVFGAPSSDAARCEEIVACVNSSNAEATANKLLEWLSHRLPLWQVPRKFWFCHELQPDCRGKTPRRVWRERWIGKIAGSADGKLGQ